MWEFERKCSKLHFKFIWAFIQDVNYRNNVENWILEIVYENIILSVGFYLKQECELSKGYLKVMCFFLFLQATNLSVDEHCKLVVTLHFSQCLHLQESKLFVNVAYCYRQVFFVYFCKYIWEHKNSHLCTRQQDVRLYQTYT